MTEQNFIDKFRYWLVASYYPENDINFRNFNPSFDDNKCLNVFTKSRQISFSQMAILENKIDFIESQEICVLPVEFVDNKYFIITFAELKGDTVKTFINNPMNFHDLRIIHHKLLLEIQSSKIFDEKIKCPFDYSGPILLYMEPLQDNLFSNSYHDKVTEISSIIKILGAHENNWSIIDDYFLASIPQCGSPWNGLIFINTKQIGQNQTDVNVPDFFLEIIRQLTSYHLSNFRKGQLSESALSKFEIQSLISIESLKQISELHWKLLLDIGQFNDMNIILINELPMIKKLNINFINNINKLNKLKKIIEPPYENWKSSTIIQRLENNVSMLLNQTDQQLNRLISKGTILSSYSQNILNTKISLVNLKLQNAIIFLTFILAILTIILAADSQTIKDIIRNIFN